RRGPALLLPAARHQAGRRRLDDRERILPRGLSRAADGVRRRGAEATRSLARRKCGLMLEIKNLHAGIDGKEILHGVDLHVGTGEVHAIMGPNGSGKSTLANVLAGRPRYEVTAGSVLFEGKDLLSLAPEDRAREGVFLAMQYPVEI